MEAERQYSALLKLRVKSATGHDRAVLQSFQPVFLRLLILLPCHVRISHDIFPQKYYTHFLFVPSATILTITCPNHEVPCVSNISEIQYYPLHFMVLFFNNCPVKLETYSVISKFQIIVHNLYLTCFDPNLGPFYQALSRKFLVTGPCTLNCVSCPILAIKSTILKTKT